MASSGRSTGAGECGSMASAQVERITHVIALLGQSGAGGVGRRGRTLEVTRRSSAIHSGAGVSQVEGHGLTHVVPIMSGCESACSPVVVTVLG